MKTFRRLSVLTFLYLLVSVPAFEAQVKAPEPVLLARGSGEISYKKGEGTNKPKFTEVDVSQYASGILYGELKVSGTCRGILITAAEPTEDRKKTSGHFTVRGGESGAGELLSMTIHDGTIRRFNSPKFYVTAAIPEAGMALWYAPDCNSTYEIAVYVNYGKKVSGTLPPIPARLKKLLADLIKAKSYGERSAIYHEIDVELKKRGIGVGFFEAASTTTNNIQYSPDIPNAQQFLDSLSQELAVINANYAIELLQTGKLANENKTAFLSQPAQIDKELVRREQVYAQNKLSAAANNSEIVRAINKEMNGTMDGLLSQGLEMLDKYNSLIAARAVREQKRKTTKDPNAQFDYGDIRDRVGVGDKLALKYRNEYLPNAILCR